MVKLTTRKQKVLHRLKISRGQVTKLINMVESDEHCVSIIHTSHSTQKALKKVDSLIMENHIRNYSLNQIKKSKIENLVKELLDIYKYK